MTETNTPANEPDNNEDINTPSDARVILGPLVKYAAMGLVLVSVIITTAMMLDNQFNDIDHEVAALEAELAEANSNAITDEVAAVEAQVETAPVVESVTEQQRPAIAEAAESLTEQQEPAIAKAAEVTEVEQPVASIVENTVTETPAVAEAAKLPVITEANTDETSVADTTVANDDFFASSDDFFDKSIEEIIEERNVYLKEMDRIYLEKFKASQAKHLLLMRERLARQEKRIEEKEKRNQEIYDIRAANVKEMQEIGRAHV